MNFFVAKNILDTEGDADSRYFEYLSNRRNFSFPIWMQKIISKPVMFALSNGWAKYFQKDRNNILKEKENEF